MALEKNPVVKEAVLERVGALQKQWAYCRPSAKKFYLILFALFISGLILAGVNKYTANGDVSVLKQRLFGKVHLSTGTYSARSVDDLNQLSWDNGLLILETLDSLNTTIKVLEATPANTPAERTKIARTKVTLEKTQARLKKLLHDRKAILKTANVFQASDLYTPEYRGYLKETLAKIASLKSSDHLSENPTKNDPVQ
jgi:hypothetical protein